jgi:hypothetical protein
MEIGVKVRRGVGLEGVAASSIEYPVSSIQTLVVNPLKACPLGRGEGDPVYTVGFNTFCHPREIGDPEYHFVPKCYMMGLCRKLILKGKKICFYTGASNKI